MGTGKGVSVDDVSQHLLETVPGLKNRGISRTTVAYLFCAPNKGRKSSERYKEFIPARVPGKKNNARKKNVASHYLFSRVKMNREFAQKSQEEVLTLSCDDMNKLNVGGSMMVSRYQQINQICMMTSLIMKTMISIVLDTKSSQVTICNFVLMKNCR